MAPHTRSSRPPPHHHFSFTSTLLSVLIFISILLSSTPLSAAQAQTPFTPVPVYGAAFARSGTHLFVLGGNPSTAPGTPSTDQFMALDLSAAWTTAAPAWIQLQPGPKKFNFPATFSKDLSTLYAFHISSTTTSSSVQQYTIKTGRWTVVDYSPFYGSIDGPGAVTDPSTGIIYCAGGCATGGQGKMQQWNPVMPTVLTTGALPLPRSPLPASGSVGIFQTRSYYANVWCEAAKGVLYFGGYGSIRPDNTVSVYSITTGNFTSLSTTGAAPPNTVNHCMAAIDDGLLVIVFGGQNIETGATNGDLYQLNVSNGLWSKSIANGPPRANAACTIAGNQFLVWGGTDEKGQIANSSVFIYDHVKVQWISQYNPPASIGQPTIPLVPPTNSTLTPKPPNSTGPSTSPPTATSSTGTGGGEGQKDDGSKGGLIGGIVTAIVVVGIIVGYILYHRRQRQREGRRQEQQLGGEDGRDDQYAATASPSTKDEWNAQSQPGRPQASTKNDYDGGDDGPYAVAIGRQKSGAPQQTQGEYKRPPQAPQDIDDSEEFEQDLEEIENQQKQLDLKRQLLVLQQRQGQRVVGRSSPPRPELNHAGSISSDGSGGGGSGGRGIWPRPPPVVGEPQYVQRDEYVPPPPPKAVMQYPTVQSYPERPTSSNYGYGYADSGSAHRGHNPQTFN
ncbi:hypothetical protein BKA57DRAFT_497045 [Linnemannia elongata]|nr:hypothetical protein BKA57DRAFT_497045 [Linnemannia elongata]